MRFSWDSNKAKINFQKHKVTFEEAATVFYDQLAKMAHDPDHSGSEDHYILIGHSKNDNLLFVVHVYREDAELIRIISARKATPKERRDFEEI